MRLNLLIDDPAGVMPGYVNLDPLAPAGDRTRVACDPEDLGGVCVAAGCDDLRAMGVLDYISYRRADAVLGHWLSRLAHGGTIALSVVDVAEACRAFGQRLLTLEQMNLLLYGAQEKAWQVRQAGFTMAQLAGALRARGLRVVTQRTEDYRAVVAAVRP